MSSDLEHEASPPRPPKSHKTMSGKWAASSSHKSLQPKASTALDKDTLWHHRALERQYNKAKQTVQASLELGTGPPQLATPLQGPMVQGETLPAAPPPRLLPGELADSGPPLGLSRGVSLSLPDVSAAGLAASHTPLRRQPEATFTPTAAGLRAAEGCLSGSQLDFQSLLSTALSSLLAAGIQQATHPPLQSLPIQHLAQANPSTGAHSPPCKESASSIDSKHGEDCPEDIEFSEDEGLLPDAPAFTGLFRPSLLKSLLHKARLTTNLGKNDTPLSKSQIASGPHDLLFRLSKPDKDFIPCPQLFSEVIRNPWTQPGSLTTPSSQDKRLHCAVPELEELLALPSVDAPVVSLSSTSVLSTDSMDRLKSEDRKAELSF